MPVTGGDDTLATVPLAMVAMGLLLFSAGVIFLWRLLLRNGPAAR
jgi:hypothetical protein